MEGTYMGEWRATVNYMGEFLMVPGEGFSGCVRLSEVAMREAEGAVRADYGLALAALRAGSPGAVS